VGQFDLGKPYGETSSANAFHSVWNESYKQNNKLWLSWISEVDLGFISTLFIQVAVASIISIRIIHFNPTKKGDSTITLLHSHQLFHDVFGIS